MEVDRPSFSPLAAAVPPSSAAAPTDGADRLLERLPDLVAEWRRLAVAGTLEQRLGHLLGKLAPLLRCRSGAPLDEERLRDVLPALSSALARNRISGDAVNVWTIAGARRREVRNAGILAALWSPAKLGNVAAAFLGGFLDRCATTSRASLPDRDELAAGYRVLVESCPGIDGSERVDLMIESRFHLVGVEIKIDAGEGPDQLERYLEAVGSGAGRTGRRPRVILLAPFSPSRNDVVAADWSMVRAAAAAALPARRADHGFAHQLIAQFARHVRAF